MKTAISILMVGISLAISACGPATSSAGLSCAEECAMTFHREATKCHATHGRESKEGMECSKVALSTNDKCAARCYEDS